MNNQEQLVSEELAGQDYLLQGELVSEDGERVEEANGKEPYRIIVPTQPLVSPGDFISSYAAWADVVEAPRTMHEAYALQIIASILNRSGVIIEWDAYKLTLDLWLALLTGSGTGKNTVKGIGSPVIKSAEIKNLIDNTDWGSKEAFYQQFSGMPPGSFSSTVQSRLYIWEELSYQMQKLNSFAFDGVKAWLTNCYDNFAIPPEQRFRDTGKKSDTPPIRFDHAPRTNILALSAESWFFTNLSKNDSTGGFVPRWIIVDAPGERVIPIPSKPDPAQVPVLASALTKIAALKGSVEFFDGFRDEEAGEYAKWYRATRSRFVEASPEIGLIFFNRHRVHVLKLAAIYEASMSRTLKVSPAAWERAVRKAAEIETTLFRLLKTGMTRTGYTLEQMENAVLKAGPCGLLLTAFTSMFKHEPLRKQHLETLQATGGVAAVQKASTGGRPPTFLVHRKFRKEES